MQMRDLTQPIEVQVGGEVLTLRLDMTAMLDFEDAAGMSVSEFVRALVPVLAQWQEKAAEAADADANATGLQMLDALLAVPVVSARNILYLAWALAGGEDSDLTPREFGRRVNVGTGREIVAGIWNAVAGGMPEADADAEPEPDGEDPTPRPESANSGL